jgi:uncharacterized protein YndB with AHSA1/START domain
MTELHYVGLFDGGPVLVFALLTDPEFLRAYAKEMGATRYEATTDAGPTSTDARLVWTVPTEGVPGFVKKLIGSEVEMEQIMRWPTREDASLSEARRAELSLDVKASKQAQLRGEVRLEPDGDRTRLLVQAQITVRVAIVGGKIEGMAADLVRDALHHQTTLGNQWLAAGYPDAMATKRN